MPGPIPETNIQQFSDIDIITEVVAGNAAMFEMLVRRYNPYLYKVGRSYGFNHQDTEDLVQETFINTYLNLSQFAERSAFKTWIIRIMLNQCYRRSHKHSYQKEKATADLTLNSSPMSQRNDHTENCNPAINREFNNVVESCLQKLPRDYRTTFALRELTGLSGAETAGLMHTTTANVKVRLNRAKAMLRKELVKVYAPEDIYEFNLKYCDKIVEVVMNRIADLGKKYPLK